MPKPIGSFMCPRCRRVARHCAKGLCRTCYDRQQPRQRYLRHYIIEYRRRPAYKAQRIQYDINFTLTHTESTS